MLLVDPLGFDAGDSNLYRYVHNMPTTATDPSGKELFVEDEPLAKKMQASWEKIGLKSSYAHVPETKKLYYMYPTNINEWLKMNGLGVGVEREGFAHSGAETYRAMTNWNYNRLAFEWKGRVQTTDMNPALLDNQQKLFVYNINFGIYGSQKSMKGIVPPSPEFAQDLDLSDISIKQMSELVAGGMAERTSKMPLSAYVITVPELKIKLAAIPIEEPSPHYEGVSDLKGYRVTRTAPITFASKELGDIAYNDQKQLIYLHQLDAGLSFILHTLPGGTAADYLKNGQGTAKDAIIATIGDVAMVASLGGSKLAAMGLRGIEAGVKGASTLTNVGLSMSIGALGIEGGVLAFQGYEFFNAKDNTERAALAGQITLRLIGIGAGARALVPVIRARSALLARARQDIAAQVAEVARRRNLGINPATGRPSPAEEAAALELERRLGHPVRRDPTGNADWISTRSGYTYDRWAIDNPRFFDQQLANGNLLRSLKIHVNGVKCTKAVVDTIGLSKNQIADLRKLIVENLTKTELGRIIDLRGTLGL